MTDFLKPLPTQPWGDRWPHEHLETPLVRPQGRNLPVVPLQAGGPQARLAAQEGWRLLHAVQEKLEEALVRPPPGQADVL